MRLYHSFNLCNKLSQRLFLINLCFFSKDPHTFFLRWLEWLFFLFHKRQFLLSTPLSYRQSWKRASSCWMITKMGSSHPESQTIRWVPAGDGENWGHLENVAKSVSLPVQLWKAQKIKQVSGWLRHFCRGSNYTCSLWPPDIMGMMSRSVHTGHHSPRHRREDLHAISNVRYELRWRSLRLKIPLFSQFDFLSPPHQSFCPFCI